jgi:glycolate oxidase FAD binding subunit
MAQRILEPVDAAAVAAALVAADADGQSVAVRGAATKRTPPAADLVLATTNLTTGIDHVAGDLVATVPAGASLDSVNNALRRERQWLPLDPPRSDRATIGGVIATNDSGPRRHRFGAPRDLIIGIEIALVDGRLAKAGGRVVKNVAGYDLSKLMCGSLGTLAVVTSATFKLSPVAAHSQTLVASLGDLRRLSTLALTLANTPSISPTAIELQWPPHRLLVRFETTEGAAAAQASIAADLCEQFGATASVVSGISEADMWHEHETRIFETPGTVVKIAVLPTDAAEMLSKIERVTTAASIDCALSGRAAMGILLLRLGGNPSAHASIVSDLRTAATARGGSAVILSAANDDVMRVVARWGSVGDAEPVMRAVKARFDPHNILNATVAPWD